MQIIATPDPDVPTELVEPDDFKHFSVVVHARADEETLRRAVGTLGATEGDGFVFVDPAALLGLPGAKPDEAGWRHSLEGMLAFAGSKGWVDDAGRVRAHVEWVD